jgi:hypothetical protein
MTEHRKLRDHHCCRAEERAECPDAGGIDIDPLAGCAPKRSNVPLVARRPQAESSLNGWTPTASIDRPSGRANGSGWPCAVRLTNRVVWRDVRL